MTKTERFLPYLVALILPGFNIIINKGAMSQSMEWPLLIGRYLFGSALLFAMWKSNAYFISKPRYINGRRINRIVAILLVNALFVLTGSALNTFILDGVGLTQVEPPWVLVVRFTLGSLMFIVILNAFKNQRERESLAIQYASLQAENLKAQLETFKQQVNPHFLFNSLNTLIDLIEEDQDRAVEFVRQFSHVYRFVVQSIKHDLVLLKDELEFLEVYWELLKKRFKESIELRIDIPADSNEKLIPPLALQLVIENAVKHNEISQNEPLKISIREVGDLLVIENTLKPKKFTVPSEGIGLENLKQRFDFILKKPISYGIKGDIYVVELPLKHHK